MLSPKNLSQNLQLLPTRFSWSYLQSHYFVTFRFGDQQNSRLFANIEYLIFLIKADKSSSCGKYRLSATWKWFSSSKDMTETRVLSRCTAISLHRTEKSIGRWNVTKIYSIQKLSVKINHLENWSKVLDISVRKNSTTYW